MNHGASITALLSIEEIIAAGAVTSLYQPIVDLDSREVVAYEALARGPAGTRFESPVELFAAAAEQGLTTQLDWACRAAALRGALDAGLDRATSLFINVEPSALRCTRPEWFDALEQRATSDLSIVVEVTERELMRDPAALIAALAQIRSGGMGVAIDDVGADPGSLALLPFIAPDIIKLDLRLIQSHTDQEIASVASAVRADAERRGAWILAEGIETQEHLERALVLGARLGQGWMLGRPAALPSNNALHQRRPNSAIQFAERRAVTETPWDLVADWDQRRMAPKRLLVAMSRDVEQRAGRTADADSRVVLGAFQDAAHFTRATRSRYERLAAKHNMVGAVAADMDRHPGVGVRGGSLRAGHALVGEWTVTVVGPHDAAALIARQRSNNGSDSERVFEYVITHDRETVVAAARSLMQYIEPE